METILLQNYLSQLLFYCIPEVLSAFCNFMLQSVLQPGYVALQMRELQHSPNLLITEFVKWVQVHPQSPREQHWILW